MAYADNSWGIDGSEITARVFNANGSPRSVFLLANGGVTAGSQVFPSLTVLENGYFVVGWVTGDMPSMRAFTPSGTAVGAPSPGTASFVIEAEIAGLADGIVANVRDSTFTDDGNDKSIRMSAEGWSVQPAATERPTP